MSTMTRLGCGDCGIEFDVPTHFYDDRKQLGKSWTCPNGHARAFREPDVQRLQRQLEEKVRIEAALRAQLYRANDDRDKAQRKLGRLKNGVCGECNRTFLNLQAHMKSKHGHGRRGRRVRV